MCTDEGHDDQQDWSDHNAGVVYGPRDAKETGADVALHQMHDGGWISTAHGVYKLLAWRGC